MEDITVFFEEILSTHGSLDFAEDAFKKLRAEDPVLRRRYREWCQENGYSERHGFTEYCSQLLDRQQEAFDSLDDYVD